MVATASMLHCSLRWLRGREQGPWVGMARAVPVRTYVVSRFHTFHQPGPVPAGLLLAYHISPSPTLKGVIVPGCGGASDAVVVTTKLNQGLLQRHCTRRPIRDNVLARSQGEDPANWGSAGDDYIRQVREAQIGPPLPPRFNNGLKLLVGNRSSMIWICNGTGIVTRVILI